MSFDPHAIRSFRPSLSFILLTAFLVVLWLAGGTSRADQLAQPVVRGAAWLLLTVAIVFVRRPPRIDARAVWLILGVMVVVAVLQLIPLPPSIWAALPGHAMFLKAAPLAGVDQPWRPIAIVPSAGWNALSSLVVPFALLVFASGMRRSERRWLLPLVMALIVAAMLMGLLELSGARFDNPFIDDVPGEVSGIFANRNHFALMLAFGILLVPAWAFSGGKVSGWRWPAALGLVLLLFLTILATGSRAGMAVGAIALLVSFVLARRSVQRVLGRYPKWIGPAIAVAAVGIVVALVAISISADRAVAVNRFLALSPEDDMRRQALPTIWKMIQIYFPFGSGLGNFATIFQIYEPFDFLNMTYFNRAHDDYLEILLNTGLAGLLLLLVSFGWWLMASARAWRAGAGSHHIRPKIGSAMLFLVFLASIVDYPARTPMMMAMITLAALWLAWGSDEPRSTLPPRGQRL